MLNKTESMNTIPVDLTVELRSADGTSTEFHQAADGRIRETPHLLAAPRRAPSPVGKPEHSDYARYRHWGINE
jgi:hypothetical protein